MSQEPENAPAKPQSKLSHDIRFVIKHAAIIGFLLAVLCHVLPPNARVVCNELRALCGDN